MNFAKINEQNQTSIGHVTFTENTYEVYVPSNYGFFSSIETLLKRSLPFYILLSFLDLGMFLTLD